jgi:hypothetical protein
VIAALSATTFAADRFAVYAGPGAVVRGQRSTADEVSGKKVR